MIAILEREHQLQTARVEEYLRTGVFVDGTPWSRAQAQMYMPMPSLRRMLRAVAKERGWPMVTVQRWGQTTAWVTVQMRKSTEPLIAAFMLAADRQQGKTVKQFYLRDKPGQPAVFEIAADMALKLMADVIK